MPPHEKRRRLELAKWKETKARHSTATHESLGLGLALYGLDVQVLGFPRMRGTIFGGPNNQDYSIFGSLLGSP